MPLAVVIGCAFEAADRLFRDQAVAVDAHEAPQKFLLEFRQRFFQQEFAFGGAYRHILELGLEEGDIVHGYQVNAPALVDRKMRPRLGFEFAQHIEPQRRDGPRARQSVEQPAEADRLNQEVDRVHLERLERIDVIGGGKNHGWRLVEFLQMLGNLEPVHFRHADVEQHHVGRALRQQFQRPLAVFRLPRDLQRYLQRAIGKQIPDAVARRRFVVHDQHPQRLRCHARPFRYGITMCTW